jgi:hypothetical protein
MMRLAIGRAPSRHPKDQPGALAQAMAAAFRDDTGALEQTNAASGNRYDFSKPDVCAMALDMRTEAARKNNNIADRWNHPLLAALRLTTLSRFVEHDVVTISGARRLDVLGCCKCDENVEADHGRRGHKTSFQCSFCGVALCRVVKPSTGDRTSFAAWHADAVLNVVHPFLRGGEAMDEVAHSSAPTNTQSNSARKNRGGKRIFDTLAVAAAKLESAGDGEPPRLGSVKKRLSFGAHSASKR